MISHFERSANADPTIAGRLRPSSDCRCVRYHSRQSRSHLIFSVYRLYELIYSFPKVHMASETDIFSELDQFDRKILAALAEDGRLSITDLAAQVGLSKTPCQIRFKRLISDGYIEGFKAVLNPAKMQLDHIAFVEVKLSDTREDALKSFNDAIKKIREVEECHMIAGRFDYLLKIRTRDIGRYRRVLGERISTLPHVASTSTNVAMETVKEAWDKFGSSLS